jgi:hypothetical protein
MTILFIPGSLHMLGTTEVSEVARGSVISQTFGLNPSLVSLWEQRLVARGSVISQTFGWTPAATASLWEQRLVAR